jgi:alpha-methylacyl-CoA racemase
MAGPLKNLKVLDFTTLLPGPYATMLMADMGADVVRVVSGSRPDLTAFIPPFIGNTKIAAISAFLGRNKRCMALNLKDPRGVRIVHQLLAEYDIVIEQFRPGVMAKLGLDYDSLKEINPALIYCSISGYGQTGPFRDRAGHDINYLARSGMIAYSGTKESGPMLMGMQIADVASGSNHAVIGILAAVSHRHHTGEGQYIDISMTDGAIAFNAMVGASYLVSGRDPNQCDWLLNGGSLYDYYECSDGKYISVGSLEPHFFKAFCEAIGRPDLIPGTVSPPNIEKVKAEVRAIIKSKTRDEWTDMFKKVDACVEPVLTLAEALADPLVAAREMVVDVSIPEGGVVRQVASPIKFSHTQMDYRTIGAPAGAHTREILHGLGYQDADIDEFEKTGLFT